MRLCLIASKPTDAVTYGFLPAAERLGLEVFLLTDQPQAHAGALARAPEVTAGWPAGTGPAGERALTGHAPPIVERGPAGHAPGIVPCDVHDPRALAACSTTTWAGAYAWNISHHSFLMHPPPAFYHLPQLA